MDESRHNAQELLENSPFSGNLLPGRRAGSEQKKKQHKHNAAELKAENDANVANMFEVFSFRGFLPAVFIGNHSVVYYPS
jgi:hypothetical protein